MRAPLQPQGYNQYSNLAETTAVFFFKETHVSCLGQNFSSILEDNWFNSLACAQLWCVRESLQFKENWISSIRESILSYRESTFSDSEIELMQLYGRAVLEGISSPHLSRRVCLQFSERESFQNSLSAERETLQLLKRRIFSFRMLNCQRVYLHLGDNQFSYLWVMV